MIILGEDLTLISSWEKLYPAHYTDKGEDTINSDLSFLLESKISSMTLRLISGHWIRYHKHQDLQSPDFKVGTVRKIQIKKRRICKFFLTYTILKTLQRDVFWCFTCELILFLYVYTQQIRWWQQALVDLMLDGPFPQLSFPRTIWNFGSSDHKT